MMRRIGVWFFGILVVLAGGVIAFWPQVRGLAASFAETGHDPKEEKDAEHPQDKGKAEEHEEKSHVFRMADGSIGVRFDDETQERLGLKIKRLKLTTLQPQTVAYGRLEEDPSNGYTMRAPLAGVVRAATGKDWPRVGDMLAEGTTIGRVEPRLTVIEQVDLASRLTLAKADVAEATAALSAARNSYESKTSLAAQGVSRRSIEEAEARVKSEEARLVAAEETVRLIETSQSGGEKVPGSIALRNERGGEIVETGALPGEAVESGQVIVRVAKFSSLLARLEAPVGEPVAQDASSATIAPLGYGGHLLNAKRVAQAANMDVKSQGQTILFRVEPGDLSLRPGAAVVGYLTAPGAMRDGVIIPRSAIVRYNGRAWAYVQVKPDEFTRQEVSTDEPMDRGWFATEHFVANDIIVVEGAALLLSEELKPQIELEAAASE